MPLTAHSTARIIAELMIDREQATDPDNDPLQEWPVYSDSQPDTPDECIIVSDTVGIGYARIQPTGEAEGLPGFQILFRSTTDGKANEKAQEVFTWMSETVYQYGVTIDGVSYLVHCFGQFGDILSLGKDKNAARRSRRVFNGTVTVYNL